MIRPAMLALALLLARVAAPAAAQETVQAAGAEPRLAPGDVIRVQIWQEPDLSGSFRVDGDGDVTLPLLGPRPVGDATPDQLRARLADEYAVHLKNPSIEVTVLRRVSVLGQVQAPGIYDIEPAMRLGDAIALAGGVTAEGDDKDIQIVRDGTEIADKLALTAPIGNRVRTGDQIIVEERSWMSRNGSRLLIGVGGTFAALVLREALFD